MNKRIKEIADEAAKYSATMALPTGVSGDELFLEKFAELIRADEREACAKLCEELVLEHPGRADKTADQCAEAIRARGEVK